MPSNPIQKQPEETPEIAYADKWLQRLLTYIPLPLTILSVIFNQTYLAILCFLWLATAIGYAFVKKLRTENAQEIDLTVSPIEEEKKETQKVLKEKVVSADKKPKTLHDFFLEDFKPSSAHLKYHVNAHTKSTGVETHFEIEVKNVMDFLAQSKFYMFYIPLVSDTFGLCGHILRTYEEIIRSFGDRFYMEAGFSGERLTSMNELKFTGRIYIYHEQMITVEQMDKLNMLCKKRKLSVIFRGSGYASDRNRLA